MKYLLTAFIFLAPFTLCAESEDVISDTQVSRVQDPMNYLPTHWENLKTGFMKLFENDPGTALMYFSDVLERRYAIGINDEVDVELKAALLGLTLAYDRLDMTDALYRETGRLFIEVIAALKDIDEDDDDDCEYDSQASESLTQNSSDDDEDDCDCYILNALQKNCELLPETLTEFLAECHSAKVRTWIETVLLKD